MIVSSKFLEAAGAGDAVPEAEPEGERFLQAGQDGLLLLSRGGVRERDGVGVVAVSSLHHLVGAHEVQVIR